MSRLGYHIYGKDETHIKSPHPLQIAKAGDIKLIVIRRTIKKTGEPCPEQDREYEIGGMPTENVEAIRKFLRLSTLTIDNIIVAPLKRRMYMKLSEIEKRIIGYEISPNPPKKFHYIESFCQFLVPSGNSVFTLDNSELEKDEMDPSADPNAEFAPDNFGDEKSDSIIPSPIQTSSARPINFLFTVFGELHFQKGDDFYDSGDPTSQGICDFVKEQCEKTDKMILLLTETRPWDLTPDVRLGHLPDILKITHKNLIKSSIDIRHDGVQWVYDDRIILSMKMGELFDFDINQGFGATKRDEFKSYVSFIKNLIDPDLSSDANFSHFLSRSIIPSINRDIDQIQEFKVRNATEIEKYRDFKISQITDFKIVEILNLLLQMMRLLFAKIVDIYIISQLFRRNVFADHIILVIGDSHARHINGILDHFKLSDCVTQKKNILERKDKGKVLDIPVSYF